MGLKGFLLPKSHRVGVSVVARRAWRPRAVVSNAPGPGPFQSNPIEGSEKAVESVTGGEVKGDQSKSLAPEESSRGVATATAQRGNNPSAAARRVAETAQDLGEKAKQTAQEAWGSAKATAQKVQDRVLGKAEEAKEGIKESAETVKRAMNTKNS